VVWELPGWLQLSSRVFSLLTVESDNSLSSKVADLFQLVPAVSVLSGDWREILPHAPFALLFVDAADPKRDHPDELLEVMQPGGMIVLDDFTPIEAWPPTWHDRVDSVRRLLVTRPATPVSRTSGRTYHVRHTGDHARPPVIDHVNSGERPRLSV